MSLTVASAHQVLCWRELKVKPTCPLVPVVPVPDVATVPVQVDPAKTWSATLAPLMAAPEEASAAATVKGTW